MWPGRGGKARRKEAAALAAALAELKEDAARRKAKRLRDAASRKAAAERLMGLVQRRYEVMCSRALAALRRHAAEARQAHERIRALDHALAFERVRPRPAEHRVHVLREVHEVQVPGQARLLEGDVAVDGRLQVGVLAAILTTAARVSRVRR